jgi:hypothetical protein
VQIRSGEVIGLKVSKMDVVPETVSSHPEHLQPLIRPGIVILQIFVTECKGCAFARGNAYA